MFVTLQHHFESMAVVAKNLWFITKKKNLWFRINSLVHGDFGYLNQIIGKVTESLQDYKDAQVKAHMEWSVIC
jgi:hypothetical protein